MGCIRHDALTWIRGLLLRVSPKPRKPVKAGADTHAPLIPAAGSLGSSWVVLLPLTRDRSESAIQMTTSWAGLAEE